jgi:hypothetical protein
MGHSVSRSVLSQQAAGSTPSLAMIMAQWMCCGRGTEWSSESLRLDSCTPTTWPERPIQTDTGFCMSLQGRCMVHGWVLTTSKQNGPPALPLYPYSVQALAAPPSDR